MGKWKEGERTEERRSVLSLALAILQRCWRHLRLPQQEPSQKSDYPLAAGMCHSYRVNQFWFSKLHTLKGNEEQLHTSHRPICLPLMPCLVAKMSSHILVFNFLPCSCLSLACCDCFCCFLTFFLNRIKALILSTNAAKMLCTYDPPFFLSCLLASEVAKFLQYASVVWLVSSSVADNFLLLFLVLVLAAIL